MIPNVDNILRTFDAASAADRDFGMTWYNDAHNFAREIGGNRFHRAAGIIAALSPMSGWENNKRKAAQLINQNGVGTGCGLYNNVRKAEAIYRGEDALDVLKGDKVRAFYLTIIDPEGDITPVIDRHAFDIAVGMRTNDKARGILGRKGVYGEFANAYQTAARLIGIGAPQMQAITWVAWRNMHGINA